MFTDAKLLIISSLVSGSCYTFFNYFSLKMFNLPCVQLAVLFANDCKRSVIGELWLVKLPNDRGRSRTQMLTERTADVQMPCSPAESNLIQTTTRENFLMRKLNLGPDTPLYERTG